MGKPALPDSPSGRLGRYFKYAIGEILLVVIGILIALQINNWNENRININKEVKSLSEIKENLNEDLDKIKLIEERNAVKLQHIDSAYHYLSLMNNNRAFGKRFSQLMPIITNFEGFSSTSVAFNNLVSTGKIEILRSDDLRKAISRYYSNTSLDGTQKQITNTTQNFLNDVGHNLLNKTLLKQVTNKDFDVRPLDELSIHKNPKILSGLFVLLNKTHEHNLKLNEMTKRIETLIVDIDNYLDNK